MDTDRPSSIYKVSYASIQSPDVTERRIRDPENVKLWNLESRAWNPESIVRIQNPRISMESISVEPMSPRLGIPDRLWLGSGISEDHLDYRLHMAKYNLG